MYNTVWGKKDAYTSFIRCSCSSPSTIARFSRPALASSLYIRAMHPSLSCVHPGQLVATFKL
jgi:hypothetical protein